MFKMQYSNIVLPNNLHKVCFLLSDIKAVFHSVKFLHGLIF